MYLHRMVEHAASFAVVNLFFYKNLPKSSELVDLECWHCGNSSTWAGIHSSIATVKKIMLSSC